MVYLELIYRLNMFGILDKLWEDQGGLKEAKKGTEVANVFCVISVVVLGILIVVVPIYYTIRFIIDIHCFKLSSYEMKDKYPVLIDEDFKDGKRNRAALYANIVFMYRR